MTEWESRKLRLEVEAIIMRGLCDGFNVLELMQVEGECQIEVYQSSVEIAEKLLAQGAEKAVDEVIEYFKSRTMSKAA